MRVRLLRHTGGQGSEVGVQLYTIDLGLLYRSGLFPSAMGSHLTFHTLQEGGLQGHSGELQPGK